MNYIQVLKTLSVSFSLSIIQPPTTSFFSYGCKKIFYAIKIIPTASRYFYTSIDLIIFIKKIQKAKSNYCVFFFFSFFFMCNWQPKKPFLFINRTKKTNNKIINHRIPRSSTESKKNQYLRYFALVIFMCLPTAPLGSKNNNIFSPRLNHVDE